MKPPGSLPPPYAVYAVAVAASGMAAYFFALCGAPYVAAGEALFAGIFAYATLVAWWER